MVYVTVNPINNNLISIFEKMNKRVLNFRHSIFFRKTTGKRGKLAQIKKKNILLCQFLAEILKLFAIWTIIFRELDKNINNTIRMHCFVTIMTMNRNLFPYLVRIWALWNENGRSYFLCYKENITSFWSHFFITFLL